MPASRKSSGFSEGAGNSKPDYCPVFPSNNQDRRRSGQRFFDILILFCGDDLFSPSKLSHGRLSNYLIDKRTLRTNRNDPYAGLRTDSKKPPSLQAVFQVAPTPISSRFLCPRPPLLLSSLNQNRHATQAKAIGYFDSV